jgi:hypothetical protein
MQSVTKNQTLQKSHLDAFTTMIKKTHQNSKETSGAHLKCGTHRLEVVPTEQGRGGEPKGTNGGLFGGLDRMMCGLHVSAGLTTAKTYVTARERVKPNYLQLYAMY